MRQFLLTILLLTLLAAPAQAQNCGCEDEGNCPFTITPNSTTQVCYEIADAFNNNLASPTQGVCGVYINFRHQFIAQLDLTLTSPAGEQVQFTGTTGTCNPFTLITNWDILFVPCSEPCMPDTINGCALPCQFDNCPANCNWPNAYLSGSYHPYSGCLEDFDLGPANGQWCLEIDNDAMFNGGTILDFQVILCDDSGFFCCEADAGNLNFEADVAACQGDSALLLDLDPIYGALVPDTLEYGYTYVIFANGEILGYDAMPDLRTYPAGIYEVCGLSYLLTDEALLPPVGTTITATQIDMDLHGPSPDFCGDIATNCVFVTISVPPPPTNLQDIICLGDTVWVGLNPYTQPGSFADTLQSAGGCDSIVNLALTVVMPDTTDLTETICDSDSTSVGNQVFDLTGLYEVLLQNQFGCDSLVRLDLTVLPPINTFVFDTICLGDTAWIGTVPFIATGIFTGTLPSFFNCDSTVTLDLTVVSLSLNIGLPDTLTCDNPQVSLSANASTSLGTLNYTWAHTTPPGTGIVSGADGPTPLVDEPGIYTLTVTAAGCSLTDSVAVVQDVNLPQANPLALTPDTLNCDVTTVQLDGSTSSGGPGLAFEWSGPVSQNNIPNPTVSTPGTYTLTVTDPANGCSDSDDVTIAQDTISPSANAGPDDTISCTVTSLLLDGSASGPAGNIAFAWTALSGNLLPPANMATATVDEPGIYQLIVTDQSNGCTAADTAAVFADINTPVAIIGIPGPDSLTCVVDSVFLDGTGSLNTQTATFQWLGNIAAGQGTPEAIVTLPGTVSLVVLNTVNGCSDTATVTITEYLNTPIVEAGPGGELTCTAISIQLDGNGPGTSIGANIGYQWTGSPGGSFTQPTDSILTTVDSAGTYYLTVTEMLSGCTAIDSASVTANFEILLADAGPDGVLTCEDTTYLLDGTASTQGGFFQETWTNSTGTVISTNPTVLVNYADTFYLTLELAFCASTDTVIVTQESAPPVADAGPDVLLDCNTGQATLDGSGSSGAGNLAWQWTGPNFTSGETSPTVGGAGVYALTVTDQTSGCTALDTALVALDTAACLPSANAGADGLITCHHLLFKDTLQASGSSGANISYDWAPLAPPAQVLDQSDPFNPVVTAGSFVFTVTNVAVGLAVSDTVLVLADTTAPVAAIADGGMATLLLTCPELAGCYPLDVSGTSTGPVFAYSWETDGLFCTDLTELDAEILGPGIYELSVTNLANGCTAADAVIVQLDGTPPVADAGETVEMPCGTVDTLLLGAAFPLGGNFGIEWFSLSGNISGGNTLAPTVSPNNPQDTFFLVVQSLDNLCRDTDFVVVFAPVNCEPVCAATASGEIDCENLTVNLSATGSSLGGGISYQWVALPGGANTCGGETTPNACADAPGFYELTVIRTYPNGGQITTSCDVQVFDNSQPPVANAGPDDDLNCLETTLTLNGTGSSSGPDIIYAWTTDVGNFIIGQTTATPTIDAPGLYEVLVTDTSSGCTATDIALIGLDTVPPTAEAGADGMLTCGSNVTVLLGSGTPLFVNYFWTTNGGNICGGAGSPSPIVCAAGTYTLTVTNPQNGCTAQDSTEVTAEPGIPDLDVGGSLTLTCTVTAFTIPATATGVGPLDFLWVATNGGCIGGAADILQITVSCPGIYTLTATDQTNGCSATGVVVVFENTVPPSANAGAGLEINCQNLQVQLDGTGSMPAGQLAFSWETADGHILPPANIAAPLADSAGTYALIVTDLVNGCRDTATVSVTVDADIPAANAGPDTTLTCTRLQLDLDGTASSTGPDIFYQWTQISPAGGSGIVDGATTLTPTIGATGTYVLEVTDNGSLCVVTDTVVVTSDLETPVATIDPAGNFTINCDQTQVILDGSQSQPVGGVLWQWTTVGGHIFVGVNGPSATVDSAGDYTLTVTHERTGCTDSEMVTVDDDLEPPFLQVLPANNLTCDSATVQLTALPPDNQPVYEFVWSGPGIVSGADTPTPRVGATGLYYVTITDTSNGCEGDSSVLVGSDFLVPVAVANAIGQLDCDDLTALVTGAGSTEAGVTFNWTTTSSGTISSPNAMSADVDAPGWYYLTVKKLDNGCTATDSALVTASSLPIDGAIVSLEHPNCADSEGTIFIDTVFGGTPPYFYSLNGAVSITYPQFSFLDPGFYEILVEDVNGCTWETSVSLLLPGEILVELGADLTIQQGETTTLEALASIPEIELASVVWTGLPDSVACPGCLVQEVSPDETTVFRIAVRDSAGCLAEDRVTVTVNEEHPFYVPTAFSPNGDNVNDLLLLYAGKNVVNVPEFRIFDRWGNLVFYLENLRPNNPQFGWDGNFEGQPMNAAVFAWRAEVEFTDGEVEAFYGEVMLVR